MSFYFSRSSWADHDEETQAEMLKLKWLCIAGIAFLVSSYYSYREFKYLIWGQTVEATVTRTYVHEEIGRRGRKKAVLVVEYSYADSKNSTWNERDAVPLDWHLNEPTVAVQYLPGEPKSSRLRGHKKVVPVWIFVGSVAWLSYIFIGLYREANEAVQGSRRQNKRRRGSTR